MKFEFIVGDLAGPSARHRAIAYLPLLEAQNVEVNVREVPRGWFRRRRFFRSLAEADLVLVQRRLMRPGDVRRLRAAARRLVFDFDDALPFHVTARGATESGMRRRRFDAIVSAADLVIAGSEPLAELAREVRPEVRVIPTAIDLDRIQPRDAAAGASRPVTVLGWIGSSATLPYLEKLRPALEEIGRRTPRTLLRIVADATLTVPGLDVEWKPWREDDEASDLAGFDVGLAPLGDDAWSRGKCGFRLLQYCAAAVPAVVTPVGAQASIVVDGESGYFAGSRDEWVDRTIRLVEDPVLARTTGRAARERAVRRFGRERWGPIFRDTLLGLMETR